MYNTLSDLVGTRGDAYVDVLLEKATRDAARPVVGRAVPMVAPVRAQAAAWPGWIGMFVRTPTAQKTHITHPRTYGVSGAYVWTLCGQAWQRKNVVFAAEASGDVCGLCSR